ncbi:hypothetical protein B296_00043326 [Ensete ventricosum]|uniref:Uncharacterized protein n=1 Tax=Ensete ventricosum TaxID=4639 RepID=A0A426ZCH4_ENSVE|nr:hypothetical protein B296_00043326 [Ensete ventricosum]
MGLRRRHLVAVVVFAAVIALRHLADVASLRRRHYSRWSSPSWLLSLPLLSLSVKSARRLISTTLHCHLSLLVNASPRLYSSLLLT